MNSPRIVGVDYGTRRVGLAVSDPLRMFARPLGTFAPEEAIRELQRIDATDGLDAVVLGWPLDPDGGEGAAVRRVVPFRNRIKKMFPGASVVEWDERDSSRRAMDSLVEAGVPRGARARKGRLDPAAAAILLQEYLDEHAAPDSPSQQDA